MIHIHKYKVIGEKKGYGESIDSLTLSTTSNVPITALIKQCVKCDKIKQKNIEGHIL